MTELSLYEYRATSRRAVDGDTLELSVDLGFQVYMVMRVRLYGINTPELNQAGGQEAKAFVNQWIKMNCDNLGRILIRTFKNRSDVERTDKYGRWLAMIYPAGDGISLNDALVDAGHAVRLLT